MSSYIMHTVVSNIVKEKLNLTDKFVYGSILPDILKTKCQDRDKTHYIKEVRIDGDVRHLPDIDEALKDVDFKDKEINMGYIAHLIEDHIWFNLFIPSYAKVLGNNKVLFLKDGSIHEENEFSSAMYSDYYNINCYVVDKYDVDIEKVKEGIYALMDRQEIDIVDKWLNVDCTKDINSNIFLTKESVDTYVDMTVNEVEKIVLKMLGE